MWSRHQPYKGTGSCIAVITPFIL
uniref:Uncharacterized protein n=1 Tax=Anguilla anguilla TaxID=7936 RepID=A0A0E9QUH2_ANGAN